MISVLDSASGLRLSFASLSNPGCRSPNEDALGFANVEGKGACFVLSDGVGGHGGGAIASRLVVHSVLDAYCENPIFSTAVTASSISVAEQVISTNRRFSATRFDMSATVVMLTVDMQKGLALWAHWGDSRLYHFRRDALTFMTEDHSLVQQLAMQQQSESRYMMDLPSRSLLCGAVGADAEVPPTLLKTPVTLDSGDAFLLCSDGFWESLADTTLARNLTLADTPDVWLSLLEEQILAVKTVNQDNYSAIAVWVERCPSGNAA